MYGREALNVVAELTDLPPIIQQKIKEVLDTKVPLIEEPTNEEEVKKELQQGAPVAQPSPTPQPNINSTNRLQSLIPGLNLNEQ